MSLIDDIGKSHLTVDSIKFVFLPLIIATGVVVAWWYTTMDGYVTVASYQELESKLDSLATKDDLNLMFNELQTQRVEGLIDRFERKGIDNLKTDEKVEYNVLKKQKENLDDKRRKLLGFT